MLPDYEGCLNLLHATYRLWSRDARYDSDEAAALADWLEMTPAQLEALLGGQPLRGRPPRSDKSITLEAMTTGEACRMCGGLVIYHGGGGRKPLYCGATCRQHGKRQAARQRAKG